MLLFVVFCPWWPWPLPFGPQIRTRRDFCTVRLTAKFHHPTLNRLDVIVLTNKQTNWQTNRRRLKTSTSLRCATPVGHHQLCRYVREVCGRLVAKDAIAHVLRINRILESPRGNALLVGVGGSGKQSLSRLAAFISSLEVFQITLRKGYGIPDLKLDLGGLYLKAGVKSIGIVLLMTDAQVCTDLPLTRQLDDQFWRNLTFRTNHRANLVCRMLRWKNFENLSSFGEVTFFSLA